MTSPLKGRALGKRRWTCWKVCWWVQAKETTRKERGTIKKAQAVSHGSLFAVWRIRFYRPSSTTKIMDKSLGTLLNFFGVFEFTQVLPLPSPHKQCWTHVSRFFFRVSTLYRLWGELQENFEKDALFYEGTEKWQKNMNSAVLSQGLLSTIVASS